MSTPLEAIQWRAANGVYGGGGPCLDESKLADCSCEWWGRGSILTFDRECPVLRYHNGVPWDLDQLTLAV